MKIKTKKEMNLPELIEWLWKSKKSVYKVTSNMNGVVKLEPYGLITFSSGDFYPEETFTVEVEEEITEDTEITALVELSSQGLLGKTTLYRYYSINDVIDNQSVAFYILNDDQTMDLIWKNGKLVE